MKLNNKGQTLVMFIILLPILLMVFALIIDLGLLGIEKRKIENEVKSTITYGLKNIEEKDLELKLKKLLIKNIDDLEDKNINIKIKIINNYISITVNKKYKPVFNIIKNNYDITVTYKGNISNDRISIIKE